MKIHPIIHVSNLKPNYLDIEDLPHNQPSRKEVNLSQPKKKVVKNILIKKEVIMRGH